MKKRILSLILCIACAFSLFCACDNKEGNTVDLPIADYNPNIKHPEGSFYEFEGELKAEGGLVALGEDFLKLMIKGEEIEFALSDNAVKLINLFNKDKNDLMIKKGTMLVLTYKNENLVKVVYDVEVLNAN